MTIMSALNGTVRNAMGWRFFSWFVLLETENPRGSILPTRSLYPFPYKYPNIYNTLGK